MNKTFAHQAAPIALAALLTTAMLFATNALASHQYRVATQAQVQTRVAALDLQRATIAGHRGADA
jgi:multisubunit Na+/H+ antiporter MnhF subunit